MTPLISVIVPVYNVKKYVVDCIQSICAQTYNNLEIILVDDGSTDGSEHICDDYKLKDGRVFIIHKENGGLSDARNVAIDVCNGDYITFIDGDDFVSTDYIETLYHLLASTNSQIAICGHKDFYELPVTEYIKTDSFFEYSPDEAIKEILINGKFTTSAWGKLYSAELFREIRYPNGRLFEDLYTTWKTFDRASKIVFTPSQEYFYRQNPTGIMNSKFNPQKLDILYVHHSLISGLKERRPELVRYGYERSGAYASIQLFAALKSGYSTLDDLKQFRVEIRKHFRYLLGGSYPNRIKLFGCIFSLPGILEFSTLLNKLRNK